MNNIPCESQDKETQQCTYSHDCHFRYYEENGKPSCRKEGDCEPIEIGEAYA